MKYFCYRTNCSALPDFKDGHAGYIEIISGCAPILSTTTTVQKDKPLEMLTIKQFQEDRR